MSATQPQIKRGGKKAKKFKKNPTVQNCKDVVIKEEGQEYASVTKVLGGGRYSVSCYDNHVRLAHKRGALTRGPNKAIITAGDVLLISLRDYQDSKCDIIEKYSGEEIRELIKRGELPSTTTLNTINTDDDANMPFDFEDI